MDKIIGAGGRLALGDIQPPGRGQAPETGFYDRLKTAVEDVNNRQIIADDASEQVIQGELGIHEGMLRIQEADISMRLMLQVRGKAMEGYKQIMNMQI